MNQTEPHYYFLVTFLLFNDLYEFDPPLIEYGLRYDIIKLIE